MEKEIEELTLLLLYLTSWREKGMPESICRSWKGYPFEILNKLEQQRLITQGRRAKSAYLTEEGTKRAEALKKKYSEGRVNLETQARMLNRSKRPKNSSSKAF